MKPQTKTRTDWKPTKPKLDAIAIQLQPAPARAPRRLSVLPEAQKLAILENYGKFYLDYHAGNHYGNLLGGESEDVLFVLDHVQANLGPGGSARISDSLINFVDPNGKIVFRSFRDQFECHIECDDMALGVVKGDVCGCDRSFAITTTSRDSSFSLVPTGFCGQRYLSCFNSCFLNEYAIMDQCVDEQIGSIKCGEKIEIVMDPTLSVDVKALLLAGAMLVFELYFAPCFGNIGEMGSRYVLVGTLVGVPLFFLLVVLLLAKLDVDVNF